MKIACFQIHQTLGDFKLATQKIKSLICQHGHSIDLMIVPEGGLSSYFPRDFLYLDQFFKSQNKELEKIQQCLPENLALLLPAFIKKKGRLYNGSYLFTKTKKPKFFAKEFLAKDTVFEEPRYFHTGQVQNNCFRWKNKKIQILICEDFWQAQNLKPSDFIIALNASPYTEQKYKDRFKKACEINKKYKTHFIYLNRVGGQDELIFDGRSFVINSKNQKIWEGKAFEEDFKILDFHSQPISFEQKNLSRHEELEKAIPLGIKDFIEPLPFSKVMLGLRRGY